MNQPTICNECGAAGNMPVGSQHLGSTPCTGEFVTRPAEPGRTRETSNYTLSIHTTGSAPELLSAVMESMARLGILCTNSRLYGEETAVVSYRTSDDEAAKRAAQEIIAGLPSVFVEPAVWWGIDSTRIHTGLGINHRDVA